MNPSITRHEPTAAFARAGPHARSEALPRAVPRVVMDRERLGITHEGEAMAWYRRAAGEGVVEAQYLLGLAHALGQGVPIDHAEAVNWLEQAARAGHPKAQYHLALCFLAGRGVAEDRVQAYAWFEVAAASGHEPAREQLAALAESLPGRTREQAEDLALGLLHAIRSA